MKSTFNLLFSRKSTIVSIGFEKGGFVSSDVYPVLKITPINRLTIDQLKQKKVCTLYSMKQSQIIYPKNKDFIVCSLGNFVSDCDVKIPKVSKNDRL